MASIQSMLYASGTQPKRPQRITNPNSNLIEKHSFINRLTRNYKEGQTSQPLEGPELLYYGYKILYALPSPGGSFNKGIWVVQHVNTGTVLLCKAMKAGEAYIEVNLLDCLKDHPNITHLYDYVPGLVESDQKDKPSNLDLIFLNFCDRGNLDSLIKRYSTLSLAIPEAFIWKVFESLAEALRLCHTGEHCKFDECTVLSENWDPVIHRDVLPGNVFLTSIGSDGLYPRIVLGDFGCGVSRSDLLTGQVVPSDLPDPELSFWAPEALEQDTYSDVYQMGLVIWCLCYGVVTPHHVYESRPVQDLEIEKGLWTYSEQLRRVLNHCLSYRGVDRPTTKELLASIRSAKQTLEGRLATPMLLP